MRPRGTEGAPIEQTNRFCLSTKTLWVRSCPSYDKLSCRSYANEKRPQARVNAFLVDKRRIDAKKIRIANLISIFAFGAKHAYDLYQSYADHIPKISHTIFSQL